MPQYTFHSFGLSWENRVRLAMEIGNIESLEEVDFRWAGVHLPSMAKTSHSAVIPNVHSRQRKHT